LFIFRKFYHNLGTKPVQKLCAVVIIQNLTAIREKFYYGIPYPLTILPSQPLTYSTTQPKCSHRMHPKLIRDKAEHFLWKR